MIAPKKLLQAMLRLRRRKTIHLTLVEIKESEPIDKKLYKIAEG